MSFFIIAGAMVVLVVCLLAYIILLRPTTPAYSHEHRIKRNVRLFQNRIEELEKDLETGLINQETFDKLSVESSRALMRSVDNMDASVQQSPVRKKWLWAILPTPLIAVFIYSVLGAYPDWQISQQLDALQQAKTAKNYEAQALKLQKSVSDRLIDRPDNLDYRFLAARFAMAAADYESAASHFAVIAEILPDDADALAYFAQAQYLQNNRQITPQINAYLGKALRINPNQTTALGLAGIDALERGNPTQAINHWQHLLTLLPVESEKAAMIQAGIKQAKEKLGNREKTTSLITSNHDAIKHQGVTINVTLAPAITGISQSSAVFIYIKAANGPPIPIAVKKITVADLPAQVFLDDSQAMMAQMKLSNFSQVVVGARVSLSGNPIPQAGDWQVESKPLDWRKEPRLSLTIKERI